MLSPTYAYHAACLGAGWGHLSVCLLQDGRQGQVCDGPTAAGLLILSGLLSGRWGAGTLLETAPRGRPVDVVTVQPAGAGPGPKQGSKMGQAEEGPAGSPTQVSRSLGTRCLLLSHTTPFPGGAAWPSQVRGDLEVKPPELQHRPHPQGW